ncbi:carboxylating nicotinate-nucleotide diphosphorylase [Desulfopila inferna]|uniref:carboxylating nicotinate-nucleotide diphosphorylase n=1 Tax=Desulfopila inferna TaxID=468528 RepID=UPI0019627F64|nr:carboxylating nicotinate-nucleotide diphosphorylase [Desulfopila inferna]MBM9606207.1 carboxylating nicotinate-nucleotide diphosphorylase [Desulfopila inferna]
MDKNSIRESICSFLREDVGRGDLTSESIFSPEDKGRANLVARQFFITAGVSTVAAEVFRIQNSDILMSNGVEDGTLVQPGDVILTVEGPVVDMLKAERLALNLLQRMCGIATLTREFVDRVKGYPVRVTDTRKTTPGLRMFEKYAVRVGGGFNHRYNLTDGVLIKDNHIAACGSISTAVAKVRQQVPHTIRIEVETDTLEQVEECLQCGVDIIMLDNMDVTAMAAAVSIVNGRALVEASGGVNLEHIENIAKTGVDIISVGALTHSAPACDIGMDWLL